MSRTEGGWVRYERFRSGNVSTREHVGPCAEVASEAVTTNDRDPGPERRHRPAHRKKAGRQLIPGRRWPRRVLLATNVMVAVSLISVSVVFGYVRYRVAQVKTIKLPSLTPVARRRTSTPGGPPVAGPPAMNILLVGSNTRTGLDPREAAQFGSGNDVPGARSDVTMILHLDPATGAASLLSIPRDLFVPLPPHSIAGGVGKIDAALNDGPNNLVAAITNDLGIPINHYIEVNFDGFRRTIDAIGGISMRFSMPLRDVFSSLKILNPGCIRLNGATALAVVRARHLQYFANGRWQDDPQSDLSRIRRDHTFLKLFVNTAKAQASNPLRLNALAGGLLNQVTVDSGFNVNTMLELYRSFRHVNADAVPETTLPITVVPGYHFAGGTYGDVDMPVEPLDHQVINAWAAESAPLPSPSTVKVHVVDISGVYRKATTVASQLASLGFRITGTGFGGIPATPTETVIHYHPGSVGQGLEVLHSLTGAVMMYPDPTVVDGSVTLNVGSAVGVTASVPTPAATSTAPTAPTAATPPAASTTRPAVSTTTIPTAGGLAPSSSTDQAAPFDPTGC
jgi:LCP family protein required for cell wall assembly